MSTRRDALRLIGGALALPGTRLFAFASDFWNKKDPSEWSPEEINQLTSRSPWAKEVSASYTGAGGRGPASADIDSGNGARRNRDAPGVPSQTYKGTIRWETAKPVMEALKAPLAPVFANHYVISVTGFPVNEFQGPKPRSRGQNPNPTIDDMLDHLKGVTFLQPKGKEDVQPGIVQQPPSGRFGTTVLFGFSKDTLILSPDDKEVAFVTEFGRLNLKAKFSLKEMLYRGELAV
jgi:hypothetical protein